MRWRVRRGRWGRGGRRGPGRDRNELAGLPGVRHAQDRGVLQEEVGVTARTAQPGAHRELAAGAQGEGPSSDRPGLEFIRPDEIGRTAIRTDRGHEVTVPESQAAVRKKAWGRTPAVGTAAPRAATQM
jgi:hypothetical protein